jgi:hypothetical protein
MKKDKKMNMRKFAILALVGASAHMHAVTPGMVVAFLQQLVCYGPQKIEDTTRQRIRMNWSSKRDLGDISLQEVQYQLYIGLRGFSYEQSNKFLDLSDENYKLKFLWNPYKHKNLMVRAGITAILAVCTSVVSDLLLRKRSLREICTLGYFARAAASGACGGLLGSVFNK